MTALNRIGLGGFLTFNSRQAEAAMARTNRAFGGLRSSAGGFSQAARTAGTAAMGITMVTLPLAMAVGSVTKKYMEFTKQMSAVQAVSGVGKEKFAELRKEAMRLGGTTKFTATEAAEGMEALARAGFEQEEILKATGAALNLAAADSMDLGKAASITANIIRGLGMDASEAGRVADVLALTSAKTNTNVTELGGAFKMAVSTSNMLGISVEETAAVLGKLADAGLKGTKGGTAFNNMMNKLLKPSKKAKKFLDDLGITMTNADGSMRKISDIVKDVTKGLDGIKDSGERAAMGFELTGLRGVKAINALGNATKDNDGLAGLEQQLKNAKGAAEAMAKTRLANMSGKLTLMASAAETLAIHIGDMFKGMDGSALDGIVNGLQDINGAWEMTLELFADGKSDAEAFDSVSAKFGDGIAGITFGIRDAINSIRDALQSIGDGIAEVGQNIENAIGKEGVRSLTEFLVKAAGFAAILAPAVIAFGTLAIMIGAIGPLVGAVVGGIMALSAPIVALGVVLAAAFIAFRKEGEPLIDTFMRIKMFAEATWQGFLAGVRANPVFQAIALAISGVTWAITELVNWMQGGLAESNSDTIQTGQLLGEAISALISLWIIYKGYLIAVAVRTGIAAGATTGYAAAKWALHAASWALKTVFTKEGQAAAFSALKMGTLNTQTKLVTASKNALGRATGAASNLMGKMNMAFLGPIGLVAAAGAAGFAVGTLIDDFFGFSDAVAGAIGELTGLNDELEKLEDRNGGVDRSTPVSSTDLLSGKVGGVIHSAKGGKSRRGSQKFRGQDVNQSGGGEHLLSALAEAGSLALGKAEEYRDKKRAEKAEKKKKSGGRRRKPAEINVNSCVNLDGKEVGRNQAKIQQDLADRMGFQTPPFVRRTKAEQGAVPPT